MGSYDYNKEIVRRAIKVLNNPDSNASDFNIEEKLEAKSKAYDLIVERLKLKRISLSTARKVFEAAVIYLLNEEETFRSTGDKLGIGRNSINKYLNIILPYLYPSLYDEVRRKITKKVLIKKALSKSKKKSKVKKEGRYLKVKICWDDFD